MRIPERICCCLDYFKASFNRDAVNKRLHSYYLFIGVVDNALDTSRIEAGREILDQLGDRDSTFSPETKQSCARLVTEVLKNSISLDLYPTVLIKLEQLFQAVVGERIARSITAYIHHREKVGRLTAELSYLIIRPLIQGDHEDLSQFLQRVGEVGCLMDSVIDLRSDHRLGLLNFKPTQKDHLRLASQMLRDGMKILLKHPRLFRLFFEAAFDTMLDRLRTRRSRWVSDRVCLRGSAAPSLACKVVIG